MFDRFGRYFGGPAPRGMTRFPVRVEHGQVLVKVNETIAGPDRDVPAFRPQGKLCLL